jgi:hypothetical protein
MRGCRQTTSGLGRELVASAAVHMHMELDVPLVHSAYLTLKPVPQRLMR